MLQVSVKRRRQTTLRLSDQEMRAIHAALFDTNGDAICVADIDRRIIATNQSFTELFGYGQEVLGRSSRILYAEGGEFDRMGRERFNSAAHHDPKSYVVSYAAKDGRTFPGETVAFPVLGRSGEPVAFVGMIRDVSQRMTAVDKLEDELDHARKRGRGKAQFLSEIGEEIRMPMNGILDILERLREHDLTEGDRGLLAAAYASVSRVLTTVDDAADLNRIEAGRLDLGLAEVPLYGVLRDTVALFRPRSAQRGVCLRTEIDDSLPEVILGDEARLSQVIGNLLGTAIQMSDGGDVLLEATRLDTVGKGHLVVQIRDTGEGIAPEILPSLFECFALPRDARHGSGLGLAIAKRLAEAMGGKIGAASKKGVGTILWFSLPLQEIERSAERITPEPLTDTEATAPFRVLIVDDQMVDQSIAAAYLRQLGLDYGIASSGEQALAMIAKSPFDAVLLNLHLSGLDGVQVTRRIRNLPRTMADIPVIGTTPYPVSKENPFVLAGLDRILVKPFTPDELSASLQAGKEGEREPQIGLA